MSHGIQWGIQNVLIVLEHYTVIFLNVTIVVMFVMEYCWR